MTSVVVHDPVGVLAGDVEVHLAGGLLALGNRRWVNALRGANLVQGSVHLPTRGAGVEIRHNRNDQSLDGFIGDSGFPEAPANRVRNGIDAWLKVADGPALNGGAVDKGNLIPDCLRVGNVRISRSGRCVDCSNRRNGCRGRKQGGDDLQRGSLLSHTNDSLAASTALLHAVLGKQFD